MSKVTFTEEQVEEMRQNPYTRTVTTQYISFTTEFRTIFYKELTEGKTPRQILNDYGYPADVFGKNRLAAIAQTIKEQAKNGRIPVPEVTETTGLSKEIASTVTQLQNQINYLQQEIDLLKKMWSIKNTGK